MKIGIVAGVYTGDHNKFYSELLTLCSYGYDCIDYQGFIDTETDLYRMSDDDFDTYLQRQKKIAEQVGLTVYQTHGPWRWPMRDVTEEDRAERFEKMAKAIRGTAILGARYMVLHNLMPFGKVDTDPEAVRTINKDFFERLCRIGEKNGVIICLENMPFPDQILARPADTLAFVKALNTPWMRVCLDVGHATRLAVSAGDAVRQLGKEYLAVMHVHDNDGTGDLHWQPFTGVTDWADFSAALGEIGFDGVISVETKIPKDLSAEERDAAQRLLFARAQRIAENCK